MYNPIPDGMKRKYNHHKLILVEIKYVGIEKTIITNIGKKDLKNSFVYILGSISG